MSEIDSEALEDYEQYQAEQEGGDPSGSTARANNSPDLEGGASSPSGEEPPVTGQRRRRRRREAHVPGTFAGQDDDDDDDSSEDSSWAGSQRGPPAGAPAAATAPPPPPNAQPAPGEAPWERDMPGLKRQRISVPSTGPEPMVHREMRISSVRRMPCVVHNYMPTFRPWDDNRASFSLLMSGRMTKGRRYQVPLDNFAVGDNAASGEDDGLANWLLSRLRNMLPLPPEIGPCRPTEALVRELHRALSSMPEDRDDWFVVDVSLELPFVSQVDSVSVSAYASAEGSRRGVDIDEEYVRLDDHRTFCIQSYDELCEGAAMTVLFGTRETGDAATLEVKPRGGARLKLPPPHGAWQHLPISGDKCEQLVLPMEWSLREVAKVRRIHGHATHDKDTAVDPIRLAYVAAACAGENEYGRWVFLLQLAASGMFAGSKTTTSAGKDYLELYTCSEKTGLWSRDHSSLAFEKLLRRVQRDISNMQHAIDRVRDTVKEGLEQDYFERDEVDSLVSYAVWEAIQGRKKKKDERASYATLKKVALEAIRREEANGGCIVREQLCHLLHRLSPEFPKCTVSVGNMRNEFVKKVVVEGGVIKLDEKRVLNFTNGVCWDADILAFRKIRPQDFSCNTTGYDKPEVDMVGRAILMDFLRLVHPNEEVLMYKLGLKARALTQNQADPVVLMSQGVGGGCKSLEARLTRQVSALTP